MQIRRIETAAALSPDGERRLSPGAAILVIGGMSLTLWSALIAVAMRVL